MKIAQIDTANKKQLRIFLELPFRIYKNIPQWVPPLETDARRVLDPKKHAFYKHGKAVILMALDDEGAPLGRLAVLNNQNYNDYNHEHTAFFYLFECVNDLRVAKELFQQGFEWARSQKLDKMVGPKGFTTLDGMGLLVKGFEHRPAFGLPYNPPYYPTLLEDSGLIPAGEMLSGFLNANNQFPPKIHDVARLVQEKRGMRIIRFNSRRELKAFIPSLQKMYNDALGETTGNIPLTEEDVKTMASQLLWFADPKLLKIIMKDDLPIGFLLAYPDISAAVQRCQGRLFPFGWIDLLLEIKRTKWVNINGAGIVEKYRGLGGTALLFSELYKSVVDGGYQYADIVQIGVENERMQLELRNLGVDFYKVHKMYQMIL
jgi:hypothetical protein